MVGIVKDRVNYIDYVKGFGILLLLLSHSMNAGSNYIGEWITSFNMPIFFIICGFLLYFRFGNNLSNVNILNVFKRRIRQLLIPYFVFCFLLMFMHVILHLLAGGNESTLLKEYLFRIFSLQGIDSLWFIPCYFMAELLTLIILKYSKYDFVCFSLCVAIGILAFMFNIQEMPWYILMLLKIVLGIFFIICGYYMFGYQIIQLTNILFAIILLLIGVALAHINGVIEFGTRLQNPILFFMNALVSSYSCIVIFYYFREQKCMKYLGFWGRNTIIVLVTNNLLIEFLWLTDHFLFGDFFLPLGLLGSFLFFFLLMPIVWSVVFFMEKKMGFLFGK